jgi:hypothetical protein|tara:strand:- start:720 stop:2069 length:1350 start_codon:yes stop_codon:yes gene_type:complete
MAGKNLDYWYDEQIKRYLIQLIRIFSNFKVKENTKNGVKYNRVPARYGDASRMVSSILRNNSENVINSAPFISVNIGSIQPARDRTHEPFLVDTNQVAEREWDSKEGSYTSEQGNLFTTQRYMPVPYNMTLQVDLWTTNTDTKLQVLEQLFVLFNPSIQLQSNDNPLDWSSVFEVELTDIAWSSRGIPAGVDENLDIATLTFAIPIWISPPAKIKRQSIIQRIIADVHSTNSIETLGFSTDYADFFGNIDDTAEIVVTPGDYFVQIVGSGATLVNAAGVAQKWSDVIDMVGELTATSLLKLNIGNDSDNLLNEVIGTVTANPLSATSLIFNLDSETLPSTTLTAVDKIIDPRQSYPGDGTLASAAVDQRYLITESIDNVGMPNWGIDATANDIIQYNGSNWIVVFDSSANDTEQQLINTFTSSQYKWNDGSWISSYEGEYNPGFWRLSL